jgi:hypothetical protein
LNSYPQEIVMKKLLVLMLLTLSASAMAQHSGHGFRHGHGHGHWARGYSGGWGWAVPAAIGGILIYEASRQPLYVQPNPVIIQQQPVYTPQTFSNCTPWTEVQSSDGTISRTRTCTQ